jgi:hypothetical protein
MWPTMATGSPGAGVRPGSVSPQTVRADFHRPGLSGFSPARLDEFIGGG